MSSNQRIKFYRRLDLRLTLLYTCAFLITTFIICAFIYFRIKHSLLKEIDRILFDEGREIAAILSKGNIFIEKELLELKQENASRKFYPINFRVMDKDGNIIFVSEEKAFRYLSGVREFFRLEKEKKGITETVYRQGKKYPFRSHTFLYTNKNNVIYIVQVIASLKYMVKNLNNFRTNIAQAFPLVLLLGATGGWLLSRRSLRPIGEITRTARRITASSLNKRVTLYHTGDELDELIITINDMISRIEEAFKRIKQFTADASHELRTPLCAMQGEIEVVLSQEREKEEYKKALINCAENTERLVRLLNRLLFLARADAGSIINPVSLQLNELLSNLLEFFEPLTQQKGITFIFEHAEPVLIKGDKSMLQQLFTNLLDNAIKYTPEGGKITLTLGEEKEMAKVSVTDTGIGIPEADLPHIFKRFYRVDHSRNREAGGSGLGLSICHFIVEAHQGRIEVTSEVNQGSTFTVYLPKEINNN